MRQQYVLKVRCSALSKGDVPMLNLALPKETSINTGWRRLQPGATAYRGLGAGRTFGHATNPARLRGYELELRACKQGKAT